MTTNHRCILASSVLALVVLTGLADAQVATCKKTETQAECHTRLKCKPDEELEDCQKRLRGQAGDSNQNGNNGGGDRGNDRDDRGSDRDDRGDDRGNGRDDRSDARGRRGDDGGGSRRGGRGGGRRRGGGSSGFHADRKFGLGFELGEPSGLNGKLFVSDKGALDFGVGWIYEHYYYDDGLHLYFDYLHHPAVLTTNSTFQLPFYIGIGLRYWDFDFCDRNVCGYDGSAIGIRVPIGLSFDFNNVPLDIFLQVVPTFDFIQDDYYDRFRDRTHFGADFSVGLRFWIK